MTATHDGRWVVGFLRTEPIDHLAFNADTTLCGEPWETRVISRPRPLCDKCSRAVA